MNTKMVRLLANMQQGKATLPCAKQPTRKRSCLCRLSWPHSKETQVVKFSSAKVSAKTMCELSPAEVCSLTCHFTRLCNQAFHVQPHSLIQICMQTWMYALDVIFLHSLLHLESNMQQNLTKDKGALCTAQHMGTDTFKIDRLCQMPHSCSCL